MERRVLWVELQPRDGQPPATPLTRALSLLLQPEAELPCITSALRQLNRRCGSLNAETIARIQALPINELVILADALLDFSGPGDLATCRPGLLLTVEPTAHGFSIWLAQGHSLLRALLENPRAGILLPQGSCFFPIGTGTP